MAGSKSGVRAVVPAMLAALVAAAALAAPVMAEPSVRIGVLKFGTVNWELDVIRQHGLDRDAGIVVDPVDLANKDATTIAFNAGDVDMIVSDWLWVSRQRDDGADFTFVPYSEAAGGLVVKPDSGIKSIADLKGKSIGVAGSSLDKSWLLLRAYSIKTTGEDLTKTTNPSFAAPPLLNEKFAQGELDGVLNFWNFVARLRARGMVELIHVQDLLPALGVPGRLPLVGFVFRESWAKANPEALAGFLKASAAARKIMSESDEEWQRLMPLTGAEDQETLIALRDGYRDGIPREFGPKQEEAIRAAFKILAELGGQDLVGNSKTLATGTLWGSPH
jgi:NitT/TauT family transport system substrate-binding protein